MSCAMGESTVSGSLLEFIRSVWTNSGQSTLAPTGDPSACSSRYRLSLSPTTACLVATYGAIPGAAESPACDAVLITCPTPCCCITGRTARMPCTTPSRFTSITRFHSSIGSVQASPTPTMPALLNITWTPPNCSIAYSIRAFTSGSAVVLQIIVATDAPSSVSRASTSRSFGASMSASTTDIPSAIIASATAKPIPLAPPVITATLPGAMAGGRVDAPVSFCESDIAQI